MAPEVIRLHIDAFVNEFTMDAGPEGERALRRLLEAACALENKPLPEMEFFSRGDVEARGPQPKRCTTEARRK